MADLIRAIEADLFGAYEWAADLYEDFVDVTETPDRLAAYRGLMRAYEGFEGKGAESMKAAEGLVAAEEDLDDTERAILAPFEPAREALFTDPTPERARAFLAVFDARWSGQAEKQALVPDAVLAALAHSNVIAATRNKDIAPADANAHHVKAAELYEELYAMMSFRVGTGEPEWKETMGSCLFRAAVAWRFAGDEAKAKRAHEIAGPPPDAANLMGRGLK